MELFNLITFLVFFFLIFFLLAFQSKKKAEQNRLPPGPWRLPLIGSLHHLVMGRLLTPHRKLSSLANKYGPLMYLKLGEIPAVVISSPAVAKQVLKTHDLAFANRPHFTASTILYYNNKDILFSPYGNYWRQMRKISTLELLSTKMVKSFSAIRKDELSNLISSIRPGVRVNMSEKIFSFTMSVIARSAFGKRVKGHDGEFKDLIKEAFFYLSGFDMADFFPSCSKLLHKISGVESKLLKLHHKFDALMEDILNEHIEGKTNHEEDLVDVLLRIKEDNQLQFPITNQHIKAVILDIFAGGSDTSSTVVIWAFSEMMRNPNIMAKAQTEVRQLFKGEENYDAEDVEKLTYLNLVVKETLRLHPPGPLGGPRECREQTEIDGYVIPNETRVLVNIWALARDPEYWHNPESFIPERFENSSVNYFGNHFEYIPFGAGKRICPGMQFAMSSIVLPLARLLHHFDWELPYGNPNDLDMTETHGVTAAKKKDLYLIPTYHKSTI